MSLSLEEFLQEKPKLIQAGVSIHGHSREESYQLRQLWCLHLYQYNARFWVDGEQFHIAPGRISLVRPNQKLHYSFPGPSRHVYAHFRLLDAPDSETFQQQVMYDEPRLYSQILEDMYEVIRRFPVQPLRAEIRFWDILWQLAEAQQQPGQTPQQRHPLFIRGRDLIELRLSESLSVKELAAELQISHNQLTRIFQTECGASVAAYIQSRRAQRAEHLLKDSDLPVKSIGIQVGYPDPHHFNKFIHRALGCSPSSIREASSGT